MRMIDVNGNKYLVIRFLTYFDYDNNKWCRRRNYSQNAIVENNECRWSLVENQDNFENIYWFYNNDYEMYTTLQIRKLFFKKGSKLNNDKLLREGFSRVDSKLYSWAYQWFFRELGLKKLEKFFSNIDENKQWDFFHNFSRMSELKNEIYLIEDWLRLKLAIDWCEEAEINYKLDVPEGYQKVYPKMELLNCKKKIKRAVEDKRFSEPFEWLNNLKDNSLFLYYSNNN